MAEQNSVCPNCGYCPHCGRGRQLAPTYPYPWYPGGWWGIYQPTWTTGGFVVPQGTSTFATNPNTASITVMSNDPNITFTN